MESRKIEDYPNEERVDRTEDTMENVWANAVVTIAEIYEQKIQRITFEILNPAAKLAQDTSRKLILAVVGNIDPEEYVAVGETPVDEIVLVSDEQSLAELFKEAKPFAILVGATAKGRIEGAKLAYRLDRELICDAGNIVAESSTGKILVEKPDADGVHMDRYRIEENACVITIRQNVFFALPMERPLGKLKLHNCCKKCREEEHKPKIVPKEMKIERIQDANFVFSGGRGMNGKKGFALLDQAANKFGGVVACSRPCVDVGLMDQSHQVGQSGATVTPKIYVACGISGAIQHRVGVKAEHIIVININKNAPFFQYCDYGIVGDASEILREVIALTSE